VRRRQDELQPASASVRGGLVDDELLADNPREKRGGGIVDDDTELA